MYEIIRLTLKGIFRDRIFQGIMALAVLYALVPTVAALSMRQVTELALTLSLSLTSVILLVLAVFLGATAIWKDIERRYTYSIFSLPLNRSDYLLGRFLGIAIFLALILVILGLLTCGVVAYSSTLYEQDRPFVWSYILLALFFDLLKYILLAAIALLLSSLSTSFFLPIFGSLTLYWIGSASQDVFDYLRSPAGTVISPTLRSLAELFYYLVPNFSAFDYRVNAIYAMTPNYGGMALTIGYFFVYTGIVISGAAWIIVHKDLR